MTSASTVHSGISPVFADRVAPAVVEVAVTLPVPGRYHYLVPGTLAERAKVGARVLVRFGPQKVTGVIVPVTTKPPVGIKLVEVSDVLDDQPSLSPELVDLCLWVADYYEAPPGEAIKAALPAGSGIGARKLYQLTDAGRASHAALPPKQQALLARMATAPIPTAGQSDATRRNLEALRERGFVEEVEQRSTRTKLKRERIATLVPGLDFAATRELLERAPKKLAAFEALVGAGGALPAGMLNKQTTGVVAQLEKAGVVTIEEREQSLVAAAIGADMHTSPPPELMPEQAVAVDEITAAMQLEVHRPAAALAGPTSGGTSAVMAGATTAAMTGMTGGTSTAMAGAASATTGATSAASVDATVPVRKPFLLHGVTGSGKTEVYLRVIARALEAGKTALVLVPEISLTPQLAARFRARFGDKVAILHSGMTEQARLGEWSRLHRGEAVIAVGARSAVFAPLSNIGVIVVDEEHDGSFKQDESPRYHARDVALVRAQRAGAVCVLGSATPSLESHAHCERGQYRRLVLTQRPTARPMPEVQIIDLRTHMPDGDAFLSSPLRHAIGETLARGDQTILFLNRRGFSTFVLCRGCGHAFRCKFCSVSMTYHKHTDRLSCHYCGDQMRIPDTCPSCGGKDTIVRKGLGTEKVADAVAAEFPKARVARLDRDVASGAKIEAVLSRVARREVDILVGTQMVTKGHDFPGVTLVGVLCADTGLNVPDFRSSERTFQLLAQVAGRAGRGDRLGRVIVQTYRPGSPAVTCAAAHDYESFFAAESASRAELMYPPHGRLIAVRIDGSNPGEVAQTAQRLAQVAEAVAQRPENANQVEIRGAVPAPIEKLRNRTRWQIWLRSSDRPALRRVARSLLAVDVGSKVRVALDVDPISTL
ncbi:MAG TPA: primosomal protein N' [Kofleriaceae bacterium]